MNAKNEEIEKKKCNDKRDVLKYVAQSEMSPLLQINERRKARER